MAIETNKGIAIGLLIAHFLISPILNAVRLGGFTTYVVIILAVYLYFFKK